MLKRAALSLGIAALLAGSFAGVAAAADRQLRVMGYQSTFEHFRPAWEWALAEFERRNPGVDVVDVPTAFNETLNQITVATVGGNPPDVIVVNPVWMPQLDALGALEPLEGLIPADELAQYADRMKEDLTFDGKLKALPMNPGPIMMVYNRDLLREAGLDPDQPPKTWPELEAAIMKVCALPDRDGGKVYGVALRLDRGMQTAQWFGPVIWGMGGDMIDADGKLDFTSEPTIKALELYQRIVGAGCAQQGATVADTRNLFAQGRAGFIFEGPWIRGLVKNLSGGKLEIAPDKNIWLAPMPADPTGRVRQFGNHGVLAIMSGSKDKELASSFVRFMLDDANAVNQIFEISRIMATGDKSILESGPQAADPLTREFAMYLPYTIAMPMKHPRWLAAMDALVPHIQSVVDGGDIQAAAAQAQKDGQRALGRR